MGEHRHRHRFGHVTFWKDGSAAKDDEAWTTCLVTPLGGNHYGEQSFGNTEQEIHRRDALLSFMDSVFELGRSAAKREIREALGIKEGRG